jgi:hypothetical protein
MRSNSAQEQRLNVDWAKARSPFEPLEPQSYVLRIGQLAAAIARQELWSDRHEKKW